MIDINEFMAATIAGIEERDHKVVVVDVDEEISPEILAQMEADGYVFAYSPAAENDKRLSFPCENNRRHQECDRSRPMPATDTSCRVQQRPDL
ncbi:hypothetical protein ACVIGB_000936 [Bradyrhizobium sp. USDA 4341]